MPSWLYFIKYRDSMMLSIFGMTIIRPKRMIGFTDMPEATALLISKPAAGKWIPYIWIKNFLGIKEKTISYTQVMSEAYEIKDIGYPEDAPVTKVTDGVYELQYREGWGTKKYIVAKDKLPELMDLNVIEKILYKGEPVLPTFTWTPKYDRDGNINNPLRLCIIMHELVQGVKEEELEKNGQLT